MTLVELTRTWKGEVETQYGKKKKVAVKCKELGDEWLSTFKVTPEMEAWKEGDKVEINITKKKSKDGTKTFINFEMGFMISQPVQNTDPDVGGISDFDF